MILPHYNLRRAKIILVVICAGIFVKPSFAGPDGDEVFLRFKGNKEVTGKIVALAAGENPRADYAVEYEFNGAKKRLVLDRGVQVHYQVQQLRFPKDTLIAVPRSTGGMSLAKPTAMGIALDKEEIGYEGTVLESKFIQVAASFQDFKREESARGKPKVVDGKYEMGKFRKLANPLPVPEINLSIADPYSQRFLLDLGDNVVPVVVLPHSADNIELDDKVSFVLLSDWDRLMAGEKFNLRVKEVTFGMLRFPTATENRDWNVLTERARDLDRKKRADLAAQAENFTAAGEARTELLHGSEIHGITAFRKLAELIKPPEAAVVPDAPASPDILARIAACLRWAGLLP